MRAKALRRELGDSRQVRRWWHSVPRCHRHWPLAKLLARYPFVLRIPGRVRGGGLAGPVKDPDRFERVGPEALVKEPVVFDDTAAMA